VVRRPGPGIHPEPVKLSVQDVIEHR
jgi:hypothetical protein